MWWDGTVRDRTCNVEDVVICGGSGRDETCNINSVVLCGGTGQDNQVKSANPIIIAPPIEHPYFPQAG